MSTNGKILLIEDEKSITSLITAILSYNKYEIIHTASGEMSINLAASHNPDLILLDLGLPDMDGVDVLKRIRERSDVPIIVVSARQNEQEKVEALDNGANDYVTKPFGHYELLARIRTSIRIHQRTNRSRLSNVFTSGGLKIDYEKHLVSVDGKMVHFTPIEYKIISLLAQNAGKVLTHDYMLEFIWGPYGVESQILRVNVANIRRKIEKNPADPVYIATEIGVGYRMVEVE